MNASEMIKERLIAQIKTNELIRVKIESCAVGQKRYWQNELVKSESICDGLRIALEIVNKHDLKRVA